jgi:hypothetical protein
MSPPTHPDAEDNRMATTHAAAGRRALHRFRSKNLPVTVRWDGGGLPCSCRGTLRDVGPGGATVLAPSAPPADGTVRLEVFGAPCGLLEGVVVGVTEAVGLSLERWRSYFVRLSFPEPAPEAFVAAAAEWYEPGPGAAAG